MQENTYAEEATGFKIVKFDFRDEGVWKKVDW